MMKKVVFLVAVLLLGNMAQAAPCAPVSPLPGLTKEEFVGIEYDKLITAPFEVEIVTGSGVQKCMLALGNNVSLVKVKGFKTEKLVPGTQYQKTSWVKVGNDIYPIVSRYGLTVMSAPEQKVAQLPVSETSITFKSPQEQTKGFRARPLLDGMNDSKKEEGFTCGGWCKVAWTVGGILVVGAVVEYNNKKSPVATTTTVATGPVSPAP
ncbi:MAG: hypothetical protein HZB10_02040 [Candidatus Yonathbacteria bacterium]|nr:hypothetical protein [Candidatus Yonathbacteria bacterium]